MKILYPLSEYVASFDFTNWMVEQKARYGMTQVEFDPREPKTNKWSTATVLRRMQSILKIGRAHV